MTEVQEEEYMTSFSGLLEHSAADITSPTRLRLMFAIFSDLLNTWRRGPERDSTLNVLAGNTASLYHFYVLGVVVFAIINNDFSWILKAL